VAVAALPKNRAAGLGMGQAFFCSRRETLAKVANHVAKRKEKHGGAVLQINEAAQDAALARLELTDLWGVAGRRAARLKAIGINTPLDLKHGDRRLIRERLGVVTMRLALELRGVPCLGLEREIPDRKSIMASRSFGRPITRLADLREAVASYTARAAEKLRQPQPRQIRPLSLMNLFQIKACLKS
jgi:DNA polymerase V